MLSEDYMNDDSYVFISLLKTHKVLIGLYNRTENLTHRYHYKALSSILDLMKNDVDFVTVLLGYIWDILPTMDLLKLGIKKEEEMNKLGDLIRNLDVSNKNQTMAFNNVKIDEIYKKSIVKPYNFTLNRRSKLINDFRSTSTLYYDVVLPFNDKNYDPTSTDCRASRDLPFFYIGA